VFGRIGRVEQRPCWRRRVVTGFIVAVLAIQVGFALNGYRDPHKFFAFQPFNESSTWRADIVRVTWDGERLPVEGGWAGYDWNELVDTAALQHPWRTRHAYMGVGATIDFLDQALDLSPPTPRTISTLDSWRPRSHRSRTHVARLSP